MITIGVDAHKRVHVAYQKPGTVPCRLWRDGLRRHPRWTAFGRRRGRNPSKNDSLDARAVALVVRQEAPGLPVVTAEDDTVVLDLLTNERDQALFDATRLRNQIHSLLMQADPEYFLRLPTLVQGRPGCPARLLCT